MSSQDRFPQRRQGTVCGAAPDPQGKMLLNAPNPVVDGSSVSHWDSIARPNQLMEPSINTDLTHNVTPPFDLTYSQPSEADWAAGIAERRDRDRR